MKTPQDNGDWHEINIEREGMMPFYTCFVFSDSLSAAQKANIAEEITRIHTKLTGAPRSFVRVLFHEMRSSDIFTGGKPLPCAMIRGVIRAGRSAEVKSNSYLSFGQCCRMRR